MSTARQGPEHGIIQSRHTICGNVGLTLGKSPLLAHGGGLHQSCQRSWHRELRYAECPLLDVDHDHYKITTGKCKHLERSVFDSVGENASPQKVLGFNIKICSSVLTIDNFYE
jgi:hypothetical protein